MMSNAVQHVAIACGGTGGHLFPGLAIAEQLVRRGCAVTLLVSQKEVDQRAVKQASGMHVVSLPAVGLSRRQGLAFLRGFVKSYRTAKQHFRVCPPHAAVAMGGFTSAGPMLAAKQAGARTFLHESNTIPGRANCWLSWIVSQAFVGFPQAAPRLHARNVSCTGTPVRPQFRLREAAGCRTALGLHPEKPVLLVMGGSQGASGINNLVLRALPLLRQAIPGLQLLHLTGSNSAEAVQRGYDALGIQALIQPFLSEMELALGAATVAVSRAGASSLAEIAAMQVPAILVPFPAATDNHQFHNAHAFEQSGAARLMEQQRATPEGLAQTVRELVENESARERMRGALSKWHRPNAAEEIACAILDIAADPALSVSTASPSHRDMGKSSSQRTALGAGTLALAAVSLLCLWQSLAPYWVQHA